jgi:hypothetical protein
MAGIDQLPIPRQAKFGFEGTIREVVGIATDLGIDVLIDLRAGAAIVRSSIRRRGRANSVNGPSSINEFTIFTTMQGALPPLSLSIVYRSIRHTITLLITP